MREDLELRGYAKKLGFKEVYDRKDDRESEIPENPMSFKKGKRIVWWNTWTDYDRVFAGNRNNCIITYWLAADKIDGYLKNSRGYKKLKEALKCEA